MIDALCIALLAITGVAIFYALRMGMKCEEIERELLRERASGIDYERKIKELDQELLDAQRDASIWRQRFNEHKMYDE